MSADDRAFLIRNRIEPAAITLVDVAPAGMEQALAEGTVDAVSTWQPFSSRAKAAMLSITGEKRAIAQQRK